MKAVAVLAAAVAAAASVGSSASSTPATPMGRRMQPGVDGWSALPARVQRALRARAASARRAQANTGSEAWTSEHHDVLNSGRTPAIGPADSGGSCRASFFRDPGSGYACADDDSSCGAPVSDASPRYFSTGVGSSDNADGKDYFYFGGTDNGLRVISGSARVASQIETWVCNMTLLRPAGGGALPAVNYGIVASGQAWDVAGTDRLAQPSGDGWLYVLNMQACIADETVCTRSGNGQVGAPKPQSVGSGSGASCLQAAYNLPGTLAGLSPPRYLTAAQSGTKAGVIILVASDPLLAAGDRIVALPADAAGTITTPLWTVNPATAFGLPAASLRGIVPALDPRAALKGVIYMPVGPGIVALNASSGAPINSYIRPGAGGVDPLVSSPALSADGTSLYVHGSDGTVWKFSLTPFTNPGGNATNGGVPGARNVTIAPVWACDYTQQKYVSGTDPCTTFVTGEVPTAAELRTYALRDPVTGAKTGQTKVLRRGEGVQGGLPRVLQTADDVYSLYSSIREAYDGAFGVGAAAAVTGESEAERVAAMASALPLETIWALGLAAPGWGPDGYTAPAPSTDGSPSLSAPPSLGDFPFATPALLPGDTSIVVPQFIAPAVGDTGIFVANAATGQPQWAFFEQVFPFFGQNISLPLGRSRSSPAVDFNGAVYVGADIDWPFAEDPQGNDTMPTLFAFKPASGTPGDPVLSFAWSWNMGSEADVPLGSASPVVRVGIYADQEVLMTAFEGAVAITEGAVCDSNDPVLECSGAGVCDCATGQCLCKECYTGADCGTYDESCDGDNAAAPLDPETIGAAVGLPVGLLLLGFAIYSARRVRATGTWSSILPTSVANRLGMGSSEYLSVPLRAAGEGYGSAGSASGSGSSAAVPDWKGKK